jgi:hypothetical protein
MSSASSNYIDDYLKNSENLPITAGELSQVVGDKIINKNSDFAFQKFEWPSNTTEVQDMSEALKHLTNQINKVKLESGDENNLLNTKFKIVNTNANKTFLSLNTGKHKYTGKVPK